MDCLFCKIVAGTIPSAKVYEDQYAYAFADIDPKAPVHILIVPREHLASLSEVTDSEAHLHLLGHLHRVARDIAHEQKLDHGFRIVINSGADGGQTVDHLHLHLLGGRPMHWPPG